jgi:hypothetical protein
LNGDGFKEVVFSVVAGFAKDPRKIYAYEIKNDSLHSSATNFMAFTDLNSIKNDSPDDCLRLPIIPQSEKKNIISKSQTLVEKSDAREYINLITLLTPNALIIRLVVVVRVIFY